MSHVHHESLEGYVEGALYQDGCEECESRASSFRLGHFDMSTWEIARTRATTLQRDGLTSVSRCELPVLRVIGQVLAKEGERFQTLVAEAGLFDNPSHIHNWVMLRSLPPSWKCQACGTVTETRPR